MDSALGGWEKLARQFLGDDFFNDISPPKTENLYTDVYHTDKNVIVCINLPGIEDVNSLKFKLKEDKLTIKGIIPERYPEHTAHISERKKGEFTQTISLDADVVKPHKHIKYNRGVLEMHFDKKN